MTELRIRRVVIVGGGTAGWMTAAVFSRAMGETLDIRVVESDAIGTVGVGESTIPQIRNVNHFLGIDEDATLRATRGTFKLAIRYNDWVRPGHSYFHAFGEVGLALGPLPFQQYWLRRRAESGAEDLSTYSLNAIAAQAGRMARIEKVGTSPMAGIKYAFQFDATLFGRMLRTYAERRGVRRTEGKVVDVRLRGEDGFIEAVVLEGGARIEGDLFIDCSGFRGLLIEGALKSGFEDWREWLACDRALAIGSAPASPMPPYTQANARPAGWQWRIPLQHRTGNGHVYCSDFMSEDEAAAILLGSLDGEPLGDPRPLRFTSGVRRQIWLRNCVAIGLAAGFLEPLESTAIHLIQSGISRLLSLFPDRGFDAAIIEEYNRNTRREYEQVRDFLVLHYRTTERRDTPFWRRCAALPPPDGLRHKMEIFEATGQIFREGEELFTEHSWLQVMVGQGILPRRHHPLADNLPPEKLEEFLGNIRGLIGGAVGQMSSHERFIAEHCAAGSA
ncbi:MAG TPA: tryptophan halogenase family protein, partial [Steroidobacteraceae bacterium]|nr:tryptophan halogenase family protein [Steroidobacteraceae bacterium]